jgi:hypothetical protein
METRICFYDYQHYYKINLQVNNNNKKTNGGATISFSRRISPLQVNNKTKKTGGVTIVSRRI